MFILLATEICTRDAIFEIQGSLLVVDETQALDEQWIEDSTESHMVNEKLQKILKTGKSWVEKLDDDKIEWSW